MAAALEGVASRPADLLARYGGEEFVLMLPNTDREAALMLAERCLGAVIGKRIPHAASKVCDLVTISAGLSTIVPSDTTDASSIFNAADKMLYKAKQNGRNCVEYAWPRKQSDDASGGQAVPVPHDPPTRRCGQRSDRAASQPFPASLSSCMIVRPDRILLSTSTVWQGSTLRL